MKYNNVKDEDIEFAVSETIRVFKELDEAEGARIEELLTSCEDRDQLVEYLINILNFYAQPNRHVLRKIRESEEIINQEYVRLPHVNQKDGKGVLSNKKLLILPLYVRANQQIALKEGKAAQESNLRNITGQVTGASKSGSLSDSEICTLIGNGSPNIIKEMLGPASHDLVAKREMKQSIIRTGDVSLNDLTDSPENKKSLRYMSEVLKAYGLDNDLVDIPIK
jgi:hypothetical protein|uniref:Uncharacterized protein n=1 Tax=Myoviridae sp. ctkfK18 TaxID=2825165 RepID=A0A8S5VGN2_9CAUD|nr:MAG TPA: hypothetical protein [Myoviridae sp. ctkfK18]